jgi:putative Holliday junction resolvase
MARLLGLDVGARRIGVALSDPTGALASPLTTVVRKEQGRDLAAVLKLAQQHGVEAVVVGIPVSLDGELHAQGRVVQAFCNALRAACPMPVETWDESFSTVEAEELLRQAGAQPSRERGRVDAAAAAVLLQRYLDARRREAGPAPRREPDLSA